MLVFGPNATVGGAGRAVLQAGLALLFAMAQTAVAHRCTGEFIRGMGAVFRAGAEILAHMILAVAVSARSADQGPATVETNDPVHAPHAFAHGLSRWQGSQARTAHAQIGIVALTRAHARLDHATQRIWVGTTMALLGHLPLIAILGIFHALAAHLGTKGVAGAQKRRLRLA